MSWEEKNTMWAKDGDRCAGEENESNTEEEEAGQHRPWLDREDIYKFK